MTWATWGAVLALSLGQAKTRPAEPEQNVPADKVEVTDASEESKDAASARSLYVWRTAGGRYIDPLSVFSLHGYVDGVFAGPSRDWTVPDPTQIPMPGQLLVPNTGDSSFQFDLALFIASEISSRTRVMAELHLVSDPSGNGAAGPGGLTFALTETTASWDLVPGYLTLSGGLFWAPFGILNEHWLGAQNIFTLIPRASGAFPMHWNERGVRINGAHAFTDKTAINYVVSVGNGVHAFSIMGQPAFDLNAGKSVNARVGLFPGLGADLDIGASFHWGQLRDVPDQMLPIAEPMRYPSTLTATGVDASFNRGGLLARSYYVFSLESFGDDQSGARKPFNVARHGVMGEVMYALTPPRPLWVVKTIAPKARLDFISVQQFQPRATEPGGHDRALVSSLGFNIYPNQDYFTDGDRPYDNFFLSNFYVSVEYHLATELNRVELSNNRFVSRITGRF
jgi:hypothetical protein